MSFGKCMKQLDLDLEKVTFFVKVSVTMSLIAKLYSEIKGFAIFLISYRLHFSHRDRGIARHCPARWHIQCRRVGSQICPSRNPCLERLYPCHLQFVKCNGPDLRKGLPASPLRESSGPLYSGLSSPSLSHTPHSQPLRSSDSLGLLWIQCGAQLLRDIPQITLAL